MIPDGEQIVKRIASIFVTVALVMPWSSAHAQKPPTNADAQIIADYKARIDKYVALRKKADDSAPPLKPSNDAAAIKLAQQGLAERIGAARVGVKPGDIFTPEIAARFRTRLVEAVFSRPRRLR